MTLVKDQEIPYTEQKKETVQLMSSYGDISVEVDKNLPPGDVAKQIIASLVASIKDKDFVDVLRRIIIFPTGEDYATRMDSVEQIMRTTTKWLGMQTVIDELKRDFGTIYDQVQEPSLGYAAAEVIEGWNPNEYIKHKVNAPTEITVEPGKFTYRVKKRLDGQQPSYVEIVTKQPSANTARYEVKIERRDVEENDIIIYIPNQTLLLVRQKRVQTIARPSTFELPRTVEVPST